MRVATSTSAAVRSTITGTRSRTRAPVERSHPGQRRQPSHHPLPLAEHEVVRYVASPHWTALLPVPITLFGLFVVPLGAFLLDQNGIALVTFIVLCVATPSLLVGALHAWHINKMVVTNQRLVFFEGLVDHDVREVPITLVTNVTANHDPLQRLAGTGTLRIDIAGGHGPEVLPNIYRADHVADMISRQADHPRSDEPDDQGWAPKLIKQATPTACPSAAEALGQIHALHALALEGSISEAEYQEAKSRLLDRL